MDNLLVVAGMFIAMGQLLMNVVFDWDSDDEVDDRNGERHQVVRIAGYVRNIIPRLTDTQFQGHFRMTREAFENVLIIVGPLLNREDALGRPPIDVHHQLLSVLWLLATADCYRSVGERFDMGKSSLFVSFERIILALNEVAPRIICWPRGQRLFAVKDKFEQIGHIPNIIGAIDGTYVPIKAPKNNPEVWVTRKYNYAMTLQAICDSDLHLIDAFIFYPGFVSDTRNFRNSDIYNDVIRNREGFIEPGDFIIGDCAYPILDFCISPYVNRGNLTQQQRNFNKYLSQTRQTIERAFALLFGQFRRLKYLDMNRMDLVPATILAACVLHNICLANDDQFVQDYEDEGREFLRHQVDRIDLENAGAIVNRDVRGEERRDNICRMSNQYDA